MLLPADSDRAHLGFARPDLLETFQDGGVGRIDPFIRLLFHMARRKIRNEIVGLLSRRENFTGFEIENDRFGALGSAIDAEIKHRSSKDCHRSIDSYKRLMV